MGGFCWTRGSRWRGRLLKLEGFGRRAIVPSHFRHALSSSLSVSFSKTYIYKLATQPTLVLLSYTEDIIRPRERLSTLQWSFSH